MKLTKPQHLLASAARGGGRKTGNVADIVPMLPKEICFFDCRHFVVGTRIFPFALTTRIIANAQQFLQTVEEYEEKDTH